MRRRNQLELFQLTPLATTSTYQTIPVYRVTLVREGGLRTDDIKLSSSAMASKILRTYLADVDREHFVVLLLNHKQQVIGIHTVSIGSLTASIVHPREVFKVAILSNAAALVCGHNHPSGHPKPSTEDKAITHQLVEAGKLLGISVIDHIIIGETQYFSFADEGLI